MVTGIIVGSGWVHSDLLRNLSKQSIQTPYGNVEYWVKDSAVIIQRHGNPVMPPHKINHHANIKALQQLGAEKIVALNSTGSLKAALKPGMLIIPHDFMTFLAPPTFYDTGFHFTTPKISEEVRSYIARLLKQVQLTAKNGVYIQTHGPRYETKAEIKAMTKMADIVGMTLASEATLACECNIPYASLCTVDNYAHGIGAKPLGQSVLEQAQQKNMMVLEKVLRLIQ